MKYLLFVIMFIVSACSTVDHPKVQKAHVVDVGMCDNEPTCYVLVDTGETWEVHNHMVEIGYLAMRHCRNDICSVADVFNDKDMVALPFETTGIVPETLQSIVME